MKPSLTLTVLFVLTVAAFAESALRPQLVQSSESQNRTGSNSEARKLAIRTENNAPERFSRSPYDRPWYGSPPYESREDRTARSIYGSGGSSRNSRQSEAPTQETVRQLGAQPLHFKGTSGTINYCQIIEKNSKVKDPALILILHGRSGSGDDNRRQLNSPAIKPLLNFVRKNNKNVVILLPQCPTNSSWLSGSGASEYVDASASPAAVAVELVRAKIKEFKIASERVYLTGVSMGGGACFSVMVRNPGLFAKAIVVCASGCPEEASRLKGNFLVIHGANDQLIPLKRIQPMVEALQKNKKTKVKFKILPNKGHIDGANAAYSPESWLWLWGNAQNR